MPKCGKCGQSQTVEEIRACYQGSVAAVGVAPDGSIVTVLDAPSKAPVTEEGFYKLNDNIFRVVTSMSSGRLYASKLVVEEGKGSWDYAPGALKLLVADDRLTEEDAREFGKLTGVCCICGATLTNPVSIEAGIGPICRQNQGW